jgi:hypothetical protein
MSNSDPVGGRGVENPAIAMMMPTAARAKQLSRQLRNLLMSMPNLSTRLFPALPFLY